MRCGHSRLLAVGVKDQGRVDQCVRDLGRCRGTADTQFCAMPVQRAKSVSVITESNGPAWPHWARRLAAPTGISTRQALGPDADCTMSAPQHRRTKLQTPDACVTYLGNVMLKPTATLWGGGADDGGIVEAPARTRCRSRRHLEKRRGQPESRGPAGDHSGAECRAVKWSGLERQRGSKVWSSAWLFLLLRSALRGAGCAVRRQLRCSKPLQK